MAKQPAKTSASTEPKGEGGGISRHYFSGGVSLGLAVGMLVTLSLASDLSHFTW